MQSIQKFQIGKKYYPSNSNKRVLMLIKGREGKKLTVARITPSTEHIFTISTSLAADEKGAYEYFLFDYLRIHATNLLPIGRRVSAQAA